MSHDISVFNFQQFPTKIDVKFMHLYILVSFAMALLSVEVRSPPAEVSYGWPTWFAMYQYQAECS